MSGTDRPSSESCETCRYYMSLYPHNSEIKVGACRRYPPDRGPTQNDIREANGIYPEVNHYYWCGEWRTRDTATN